jgi:hypothetical protein
MALTPLQRIDGTAGAENPFGLACRFWQLVFAGLTTMTFREKGAEGVTHLWARLLAGSQQESFLAGLDKLGIDRHGPPAVVAGQYHYLTNVIGGLHMQYIEESPQKVWNRNMGPMWAYPGLSMLALPPQLRRVIMATWHPQDGRMLGSRRLGWVITKTQMEGEPYDEGYFQEYPYDLSDSELVRYELAARTPECDIARQPVLDPRAWPPIRIFKARRGYTRGYVMAAVDGLLALYGEQATAYMLRQRSGEPVHARAGRRPGRRGPRAARLHRLRARRAEFLRAADRAAAAGRKQVHDPAQGRIAGHAAGLDRVAAPGLSAILRLGRAHAQRPPGGHFQLRVFVGK